MSNDLLVLAQNLQLVDEMYARYEVDPMSLDPAWRRLFADGTLPVTNGHGARSPLALSTPSAAPSDALVTARAAAAWNLVNAYRVRGHLAAEVDPLGLLERPTFPEFMPETYGFSKADLGTVVQAGGFVGLEQAPLGEVVARCREAYCGSIGVEFMHIRDAERREFLQEQMETRAAYRGLERETKIGVLSDLVGAEEFEQFVHRKYPGTKRFSLEGAETTIPMLNLALEHACRLGCIEAVIGMAHRGRLTVLTHVMQKKARDVFMEFEDIPSGASMAGGDVKYHLGYSTDRVDRAGRRIHVSLAFNPSHLEAVNPVVIGRVRAKQRRFRDWEHAQVLGILIHGDAAFAGQGLVAETLNLSEIHGYRTGGTLHFVVNNQIGFTATPHESRSTTYCTDIAKMIQVPIFHVNGEDPDACAAVMQIAMEYRARFHTDVVVDMYCYRRFGHNEMDEPGFTQPVMYRIIQQKKHIPEIYGQYLVEKGVITSEHLAELRARIAAQYERELEIAKAAELRPPIEAHGGVWGPYKGGPDTAVPDVETGVPRERLEEITRRATSVPEGFHAHGKILRLLQQREEMGTGKRPLDWAMGELLAFGSLLWEGTLVRLSGQDSGRGTFSQRHAILVDQDDGREYVPLKNIRPGQAEFLIYDSPLSEAGCLGFEFGYSLDYPDALVIWEAQFGDFANGAQVIIDQFLASSEEKWRRICGLTLLLPHGYEGQGPEHSSARPERFLKLCAEDNWQVCQPSTPAQIFHLLRRQVVRPWRKPLVVLTPKSLLRLPEAASDLSELTSGCFSKVIGDQAGLAAGDVKRIVLCSGRVYYDLVAARQKRQDQRTAILRIEQLYPWPAEELTRALGAFPQATELVWVQDEPRNQGPWSFVAPRLRRLFQQGPVLGVTRKESASPATGSHRQHVEEQRALLAEAFGGL